MALKKNRKSCEVPDATIHRLPLYLEKLKLLQAIGVEDVSSRQLAESLDIKASQLRHDFHYFGGFSRPGRPYQVEKLVPALEKIIGIAEPVPTAIVGAGHLVQDHPAWLGATLAFSAGTFLCIACADLLPELQFHSHDRFKLSVALLVGLGIAILIGKFGHTEHETEHDHGKRTAESEAV